MPKGREGSRIKIFQGRVQVIRGKVFNRCVPHQIDENDLPSTYANHPVTLEHGQQSFPIGYFSDGVPHTKTDSFIAHYWSNPVTSRRYLICAVRKKDLCQCGCKGWCTFTGILRVIVWSMNALACGRHPEFDHNGDPFKDDLRWANRGFQIAQGTCGALCEYRGDLLEMVSLLGFKRWQTPTTPCMCCRTTRDDMFNYPVTMDRCSWAPRDQADYNRSVTECMTQRMIANPDQLARLVAIMDHDEVAGGFALQQPFPELNMRKGHRLIEDAVVRDVERILELDTPVMLSLFDSKSDVGLNLLCPLFLTLGFGVDCIHLDGMHIADLGVAQYLIGMVFYLLVKNNHAQSTGSRDERRLADNMRHLRRRLKVYYRVRMVGKKNMSRIQHLSWNQTDGDHPRLKAKAAQTRQLMPLLPILCRENRRYLGDKGVFFCNSRAMRSPKCTTSCTESDAGSCPALHTTPFARQLCNFSGAGSCSAGMKYKRFHMMFELIRRAKVHGNPARYWCYPDEGENRVMGIIAKALHHGPTFYTSFLERVLM